MTALEAQIFMNHSANKCFLLALVASILLTGCGHRSRAVSISPDYAKALANAKRAGLLTSMAEMQANLPPASENAAPLYDAVEQITARQAVRAARRDH